ncbi:FecR family protein [Pararcticibacter amylolyticus]|uniref:Anti-sigma factor n=1 Tax=Pararcticibacter amylolyticus TaxID=2173175 RepID=A0A2U2PKT5_9SPHI|nr:FecR domain-containing protein [Pararcticibacter amylolyticus]PWG81938.1 anti-sigma factor [Pararcticibacter amylolyticus]
MNEDIYRKLWQKLADGKELSGEEEEQLRKAHRQMLEKELEATANDLSLDHEEERGMAMRRKVDQQIADRKRKRFRLMNFGRIAAALLVGFTLLAATYWSWSDQTSNTEQLASQTDILPGRNKALLTLSDGSVISLNDAKNGTIAVQGGVHIEKDKTGNIRYTAKGEPGATDVALNTIATPNGGQYRITLPDGSIAMLNAASSLSYPVRFSANERRVKMTGEVYFEIEKLQLSGKKGNVPFFVETEGQLIQVLGTHFNVNAYGNEGAIRTTLVEGSVKVSARDGQSALLKPGEQSLLAGKLDVQQADIQQQLAWVSGDFVFRGETLEGVMRQVARWYDVEIDYPPHIGSLRFNGMVSRSQPLSVIVKMIQATHKASVTIKGRRLIVTD